MKSFIDVFYHQILNGIQGCTTRAPPLSHGGKVRTGDQTMASPMPWPLGHDIHLPWWLTAITASRTSVRKFQPYHRIRCSSRILTNGTFQPWARVAVFHFDYWRGTEPRPQACTHGHLPCPPTEDPQRVTQDCTAMELVWASLPATRLYSLPPIKGHHWNWHRRRPALYSSAGPPDPALPGSGSERIGRPGSLHRPLPLSLLLHHSR